MLARGCRLVRTMTSTLQTRTLGPPHRPTLALARSYQSTVSFSPVLIPVWRLFLSCNNVSLVIACMAIDDFLIECVCQCESWVASVPCPRPHLSLIIIKLAASAFFSAYSWVFNPSLVSHSISPKDLSNGEHEEQLQWPGQ
jgi:hypothetical protein